MTQEIMKLDDRTSAISERVKGMNKISEDLSKLPSRLDSATAIAFAEANKPRTGEIDRLNKAMDEADAEARMQVAQDSVRSGKLPILDLQAASVFVLIGLASLASVTFVTMAIAASVR